MKTKLDILAEFSSLVGEKDTVEIHECIRSTEADEQMEGIAVHISHRRLPNSLIRMVFYFPKNHNGVFVLVGNGGLGSSLNYQRVYSLAQMGYAVVHTDTGTSRGLPSMYNNPDAIEDFGHIAVFSAYEIGQRFYRATYEKTPEYSYYWGGSTGGQMGMSLVLRHPECFDGVIVGAPANPRLGVHLYFIWTYQKLRTKDPYHLPLFTREECEAIHRVAIDFHQQRGLMLPDDENTIAYPVTDDKDIDAFLSLVNTEIPLTDEQKSALYDVYHGPRNGRTGEPIHAGLPIGTEFHRFGLYDSCATEVMLSHQWLFHFLYGDSHNPLTFDFDKDYRHVVDMLSEPLNACDPDISTYLLRGGKLIMFAGTADSVVPYKGTLDYVEAVRNTVAPELLKNFTFYILPTCWHNIASAPASIVHLEDGGSMLDVMRAWVEEGKIPGEMIVTTIHEDGTNSDLPIQPC